MNTLSQQEQSFAYLARLADIVADIDMSKNEDMNTIPGLIAMAMDTIDDMKSDLLDIGNLPLLTVQLSEIPTLENKGQDRIEAVIDEIQRLLGEDSVKLYGEDEDGACACEYCILKNGVTA